MVESGMTPYQVLLSGTRRVAEYFGTLQTTGTVAQGKRADLVLVNGNPLEDVANVAQRSGVMVNGRWISEDEIQTRLQEVARAYGQQG
jgi:imidazolonepropionase-like amidohydrolase